MRDARDKNSFDREQLYEDVWATPMGVVCVKMCRNRVSVVSVDPSLRRAVR
ncbi:hypothetical protein BurMR1_0923, partial [Burkholderia sp. MR1]